VSQPPSPPDALAESYRARRHASPWRRRLRRVLVALLIILLAAAALGVGVLLGVALGRDPTPARMIPRTGTMMLVTVTETVATQTQTIVVTG
jgi:hypothetical protein